MKGKYQTSLFIQQKSICDYFVQPVSHHQQKFLKWLASCKNPIKYSEMFGVLGSRWIYVECPVNLCLPLQQRLLLFIAVLWQIFYPSSKPSSSWKIVFLVVLFTQVLPVSGNDWDLIKCANDIHNRIRSNISNCKFAKINQMLQSLTGSNCSWENKSIRTLRLHFQKGRRWLSANS